MESFENLGFSLTSGIGLLAALVFLFLTRTQNSWPRSIIKTIPLVAFSIAGILVNAPWLLVVGLILSASGDFWLSRDGDTNFLIGLISFALAHIAYIAHFIQDAGVYPWQAYAVATVPAVVLTLIVLSTEVWLSPHTGALRWPVRGYALVIGTMGLTALLQPNPFSLWGAIMFIASDLILSVDLFRLKEGNPLRWYTGTSLWMFYIAGQFCLLLGGV